jgi:hypothetical protein
MPLSPEQQQLLNHEGFVSDLLKKRLGASETSPPAKPSWLRFLESSGGTALITVLIGGIMGTIITSAFQNRSKEREFQRSWMEARGNQSLVAYGEYLKGEQANVRSAFELIGSSIAASENLVTLTESDFDLTRYQGQDREIVKLQRQKTRDDFTKKDEEWRDQRQALGFLMRYYHPNSPDVSSAWEQVQSGVSALMGCRREWYLSHTRGNSFVDQKKGAEACKPELESVDKRLQQLTNGLEQARHYAWEGWESPEKMKALLAK